MKKTLLALVNNVLGLFKNILIFAIIFFSFNFCSRKEYVIAKQTHFKFEKLV